MAEHPLPIHRKTNAYIPSPLSGHFAFCRENDLHRQSNFVRRNFRSFLRHHAKACKDQATLSGGSQVVHQHLTSARSTPDSISTLDEPLAVPGEHDTAKPMLDAVSKDTLLVKTMDPDFEPARRSVRRLTQRIFDDDEAELVLAPTSIRKKINFAHNRPDEAARPRKKIRADKSVQRTKCHCTLTIWDNRDGLEEAAAALAEKHVSCMATWYHSERTGHVVDIEPDKPFKIRAGDLKVPTPSDGDSVLSISNNYFMELKIWPTKEGTDWPPIPLLGKSDGDVNRPNRSAHTVLSGSLVAKFNNLPKLPDKNTPLSIFYLDDSGAMLRTKYGLEVHGEWHASNTPKNESPGPLINHMAWAVDDSNQFLGSKKRPRANSTPKTPPRRRKLNHHSPRSSQLASVRYLWEADPSIAHLARPEYQTTVFDGLGCPACPTYDAQDLWELRFHFLSAHPKFNFALEDEEYNHDTGQLIQAFFRVSSVQSSRRQRELEDERTFLFQAASSPFDLAAYLEGDTSWTGEDNSRPSSKSRPRGPGRPISTARLAAASQRISGFVPDPMIAIRQQHNGHLPPEHVLEFRNSSRQKYKPVVLIRHTDTKTQCYDSISHRPTELSEEPMSETDDERDDEWYIQRHLENLDVDAEEGDRNDMKQELFRRWDRHRLDEKLDHIAFISESLIRFVKRNRHWLKNGDADLRQAFGAFTGSLLSDDLINAQVEGHVRSIIWRDASDTNGINHKTAEGPHSPDEVSTNPTTDTFAPVSPQKALEKWRAHVLAQAPNHCGVCAAAITNPTDTSILCSARECKTPDVRFHFECVKIKHKAKFTNEKAITGKGWVCMGCRLESKEAARTVAVAGVQEQALNGDHVDQWTEKGKGKERAR